MQVIISTCFTKRYQLSTIRNDHKGTIQRRYKRLPQTREINKFLLNHSIARPTIRLHAFFLSARAGTNSVREGSRARRFNSGRCLGRSDTGPVVQRSDGSSSAVRRKKFITRPRNRSWTRVITCPLDLANSASWLRFVHHRRRNVQRKHPCVLLIRIIVVVMVDKNALSASYSFRSILRCYLSIYRWHPLWFVIVIRVVNGNNIILMVNFVVSFDPFGNSVPFW